MPKVQQKNSISQFNQSGHINSLNFTSFSDKKFSIHSYNRNSYISITPSNKSNMIWDIIKIILIQKRFRKFLKNKIKKVICRERVLVQDHFFSTKFIYKKEDYLKILKIQNMMKKWIIRIREKKSLKSLLDRIIDLKKAKNNFEKIKRNSFSQPRLTHVTCENVSIINSKPKRLNKDFDINKAVYLEFNNSNSGKKINLQLINSGFFGILSESQPKATVRRNILKPVTIYKQRKSMNDFLRLIFIQRIFKNKLRKIIARKKLEEQKKEEIVPTRKKVVIKPSNFTKKNVDIKDLFKLIRLQRRFRKNILKFLREKKNLPKITFRRPILKPVTLTKNFIGLRNLCKIIEIQKRFKNKLLKLKNERLAKPSIIIRRPILKPITISKNFIGLRNLFKIIEIQRRFKNKLLKLKNERKNKNNIPDVILKRPLLKSVIYTKNVISYRNIFKIIKIQRKFKNLLMRLIKERNNKVNSNNDNDNENNKNKPDIFLRRSILRPTIFTKNVICLQNLFKIIKIQTMFKSKLLKIIKERSKKETIKNLEEIKPARKRPTLKPLNLVKQIKSLSSLLKIIRIQKMIKDKFRKILEKKKNLALSDSPKYDIRPIIRNRLPFYAKVTKKSIPSFTVTNLQKKVRNFLLQRKYDKFKKYSKFFDPLSLYVRKWVYKLFKSKPLLKFMVHMKFVCSKTDKVLEYLKTKNCLKKHFETWRQYNISKRAKENLRYLLSQVEEPENLEKIKEANNHDPIPTPFLVSKKLTFDNSKINYSNSKKLSFDFKSHELKLINVIQARGQAKDFYNFYFVPKMMKKINSNLNLVKKNFLDDLKFYARLKEHKNKLQLLKEEATIKAEQESSNVIPPKEPFNYSSKINLDDEQTLNIKKLHFSFNSKKYTIVNTLAAKNGFNYTTPQEFYTYYMGPNLNKIYGKNLMRLKNYVLESLKKRRVNINLFEKINKRYQRNKKLALLLRLCEISLNKKFSCLFNRMNKSYLITNLKNRPLNQYLKLTHLSNKLNKILIIKNKEKFMFNLFSYVMSKFTLENNKSSLIYSIIKESIKNDYLLRSIPSHLNYNIEMKMKISSSINDNHENIFKFLNRYSAYIKGYEKEELIKEKDSRFEIKSLSIPNKVINVVKPQPQINSKANQIEMLKKLQMSSLRNHGFLVSRNETITLSDLEENTYKNSNLNTSNISII
jgi:hypothetical protein